MARAVPRLGNLKKRIERGKTIAIPRHHLWENLKKRIERFSWASVINSAILSANLKKRIESHRDNTVSLAPDPHESQKEDWKSIRKLYRPMMVALMESQKEDWKLRDNDNTFASAEIPRISKRGLKVQIVIRHDDMSIRPESQKEDWKNPFPWCPCSPPLGAESQKEDWKLREA